MWFRHCPLFTHVTFLRQGLSSLELADLDGLAGQKLQTHACVSLHRAGARAHATPHLVFNMGAGSAMLGPHSWTVGS